MNDREITIAWLGWCHPVEADRIAALAAGWFRDHGTWAMGLPQSQWEAFCRTGEKAADGKVYEKALSEWLGKAADKDDSGSRWGNEEERKALLAAVRAAASIDRSAAAEAFKARLSELPDEDQRRLRGKVSVRLAREFVSAIVNRIGLERKKKEER
jgi:hypothetical protein